MNLHQQQRSQKWLVLKALLLCGDVLGSTGVNGPNEPLLSEATQIQPQHMLRCAIRPRNHWRLGLGLGVRLGLDPQHLVFCLALARALALASSDCVGGLHNATIFSGCICVASVSSAAFGPFTPVDPMFYALVQE